MLEFKKLGKAQNVASSQWESWNWQLKMLTDPFDSQKDVQKKTLFLTGATPYYLRLIQKYPLLKSIVKSSQAEYQIGLQSMEDPLGEKKNSPFSRLIHRYPDRVLFLVTDHCAVYCRYCTRKRFTGKKQALVSKTEQEKIYAYIQKNKGIREVILSGGDPLTLSDLRLDHILQNLRKIKHIEIIRIASRLPVVCPMRLTDSLCSVLKKYQPLFLMVHFNHPLELTQEVQESLNRIANAGILMFNQTVLLKGFNNHPAIIQALMRRLLYLRVKPYYMFQCDPSQGSDHFRTTIENSKWIQQELWGRLSGLALPNLSVDIPGGGGKVGLVPNYTLKKQKQQWKFKGWDGLEGIYKNPEELSFFDESLKLCDEYAKEWEILKKQTYGENL